MTLRQLLLILRSDPGKLGIGLLSYPELVAYLHGWDEATGLLTGLTEWLIPRVDGPNEKPWDALVLLVTLEGNPTTAHRPLTPEENQSAIAGLLEQLEQFDEVRRGVLGLRRIFRDYVLWLHVQPWFGGNWLESMGWQSRER